MVALEVVDKKLGYLICSYNEGLIIIRSFLFLTNTGTPEGNRLSELTSMAPMDKKHLGIDAQRTSGIQTFRRSSTCSTIHRGRST